MAKHPHRLILLNSKTWRCTLPGCNFFVHLGLAHVLLGKTAICWDCGEQYTVDERALKFDTPKCATCRGEVYAGMTDDSFIDKLIEEGKRKQREDKADGKTEKDEIEVVETFPDIEDEEE